MKTAAIVGAVVASVALFAGPAAAHTVPKQFQCVPIEGNQSRPFEKSCDVWFTNGEFAGDCSCGEGFSLYDPISTLLQTQDQNTTGSGSPGKASGS